jgi:hypothetical protein
LEDRRTYMNDRVTDLVYQGRETMQSRRRVEDAEKSEEEIVETIFTLPAANV